MSILFTLMIFHGFAPQSFIRSNIIPLPKGSKVDMSDSTNYRRIAIGSIISIKFIQHYCAIRLMLYHGYQMF